MSEVPPSWTRTTLGSAVEYGEAEKAEPDEIPGDAWVLELEDIEKDSSLLVQRVRSGARQSKSTKNRFRQGDVLYGKLRPYLNKVLRADEPGFCTTEIIPIRSSPAVEAGFLFYWLKHPAFLRYVIAASHGMNMPRLGTEAARDSPFVLAPVNEQRRIVAKLDATFEQTGAMKARLERMPALLEKLKRSILAAAFRGDLTKDWRAAHPEVEPADQMLANGQPASPVRRGVPERVHLSDVVEGWELPSTWTRRSVAALLHGGALVDVKDGNHGANHPKTSEFSESGLPFITAAQVSAFQVDYEGAPKIGGAPLKRLRVGFAKAGDVVLTHKGTVGRTAVCDRECVLTPQTTYYRCRDGLLDPWFVAYFMAAPQFVAQYTPVMSQTTRNFVPISGQYELFLAVPPFAEQQVIVGLVARAVEILRNVETSVEAMLGRVSALGEAALAKAFRGELVPQDPTDEPASVLLDRIRATRAAEADQPRRGRGQRRDQTTMTEPNPTIATDGPPTNGHHDDSLDLVIAIFQSERRLTATAIAKATGLDTAAVKKALNSLVEAGQVRVEGTTRSTAYEWTV